MPFFDTALLNKKTDANQNMTVEYFNTKFHRDSWKQKQPLTFWYCVDNFYPWKDIVGKKVSKLRSIAELRAFYGSTQSKSRHLKNWPVEGLRGMCLSEPFAAKWFSLKAGNRGNDMGLTPRLSYILYFIPNKVNDSN